MKRKRSPYFTISRRQWRKMPARTKWAITEMFKCLSKQVTEGKLPMKKP